MWTKRVSRLGEASFEQPERARNQAFDIAIDWHKQEKDMSSFLEWAKLLRILRAFVEYSFGKSLRSNILYVEIMRD